MTNEEKMLDILAGMSLRLESVDARLGALETTALKTNIDIETDVKPKLHALADGHAAILEQLTPRCRMDEMEREIRLLKALVYQLSGEVQALKAG